MNNCYAQIDNNGLCIGESCLSDPVEAPDLIPISTADGSYLGKQWRGGTWNIIEEQPDLRPRLIIVSIASDPAAVATVSEDMSDITTPIGTTITISAEVHHPANDMVLDIDGSFRMPIVARDGREFIVLAVIQKGRANVTIPLKQSGVWSVTEDAINAGLPPNKQMQFSGVTAYVLER